MTLTSLPAETQVALGQMPSNERKIAELYLVNKSLTGKTPETYKQLFDYYKDLATLSGVKETPSKDLLINLCEFTFDNFQNISIPEIKKAFSMAFANKLNIENVENYGQMTPQWIGKIIHAYVEKRNKELIIYNRELERLKQQKEDIITNKESDKIFSQGIIEHFNSYKKDKKFYDIRGLNYDWLERKGYIKLSAERKNIIHNQAKEIIEKKSNSDNFQDSFEMVINSMKNPTEKEKIIFESKTICVKMFFDECIKNEKDLKQVFVKYLS